MSNTHGIADTAYELQATCEDLLPACVISTTFPTVPVSSMTLAAFATQAYVRDAQALVYVDQPAITLPLSGSSGTYWLAISRDVSTAYATWTRRAGSHYLWQLAGARPPDVNGLLVFASCTVAGGVITAVAPAPGVTRAEAWRTLAALGTMSLQPAEAVAISGGNIAGVSATGLTALSTAGAGAQAYFDGPTRCNAMLAVRGVPGVNPGSVHIFYPKATDQGIQLKPTDTDTGGGTAILFQNVGAATVGTIITNASTTAYNTSSDVRLKHAVAALAGALDRVQALRPVAFRWNADDSAGHGFLAHELQQTIPDAVTGEPDAVNEDGSVRPQQVDHSKLVPWLTAALQETLAQVQALTARVAALEEQLGL